MFRKLRNHFLILNLSIITVLMLIAFVTIYIVTANDVHQSITRELYRIADFSKHDKPISPQNTSLLIPSVSVPNESQQNKYGDNDENHEENQEIFGERMSAFLIRTDQDLTLINWVTFFKTDDDFLEKALQTAISQDDERGAFSLDDSEWAFIKQADSFGYTFAFVDMTTQKEVLDRLILTFIVVSIVMMAVIFFISRFLTEKAIQPIQEAFEKQKQFISDASHELKTPLAVIGTNVDVLLASEDNHENKWLKYIQTEVVRMGQLTNDLLYLTQLENAEDHQLLKSEFDLSQIVEQILLGIEVVAFEKHIELTYDVLPEARVYGNPEQLSQVIIILLDNALKYTPEKGQIQLHLSQTQHHYALSIRNTGPGIQPDEIDKIFDRFYRVDKVRSRDHGSYGLGLSIAKSIIEKHGGKISCTSQVNEWTTFTFKLKSLNKQ